MRKKAFQLEKSKKVILFAIAALGLYALKKTFLQPSVLYSRVYWWIDFSGMPEGFRSESGRAAIISDINGMLNNEKGWGSCGICFEHTKDKERADILIYPTDYLKNYALGVTEWYIWNKVGRKNECIIRLLNPETCGSTIEFFQTLNHEFGHALMALAGLLPRHSRDQRDLMYRRFSEELEFFPSEKYIRKLRPRVIF